MATINTNPGAMIALQNLNKTNMDLQQVQQRINTGLAVSSAKDNGGVFAIAQSMRADVGGYKAVSQSLDLAQSTVDVALAAGEAISDLMVEMKEKALAAADTSLDTASRNALNADFQALRDQITTIVSNAEFNGTNLISNGASDITALANADGSNVITIGAEDLSLTGGTLTIAATTQIDTATECVQRGVGDRHLAGQLELSAGAPGHRLEVAGNSQDLRRQAVRRSGKGHRQPGRRGYGQGIGSPAVPAGEAAAGHPGAVDRQLGAEHDPGLLPIGRTEISPAAP
jgi:flagellin-like hook-associated protein FlgL